MIDAYPQAWEEISTDSDFQVLRLKVPGGWLVAVRCDINNVTEVVFVSNPEHSWTIES